VAPNVSCIELRKLDGPPLGEKTKQYSTRGHCSICNSSESKQQQQQQQQKEEEGQSSYIKEKVI
jgi:hypothetical protein